MFTQRFFYFALGVMEGKRVGGGDVDELQKATRAPQAGQYTPVAQ